ncbi:MAG: hypothetical protein IJU50_08600, partial [Lachnospiraceae bacterium]|nr:hypothetical protein [Lachnospiraceae bacterium]
MGLFGLFGKPKEKKFCPICGDEMEAGLLGAGTAKTLDGEICANCWQRFREKSRADLSGMTTSSIRDIIEGNDGMTGEPCPICGKTMGRDAMVLVDSIICADCERLLRGMYFKD